MKLINYLFAGIFIAFTFSSCNENDKVITENGELAGNWLTTQVNFEGSSTIENSGTTLTSSFNGEGYNLVLRICFDKDLKEFTSFGGYDIHLNTNDQGTYHFTEWMNPGFMRNGKWETDGNSLLITDTKGVLQSATILSLDQKNLVLSYSFTYKTEQHASCGTYTF